MDRAHRDSLRAPVRSNHPVLRVGDPRTSHKDKGPLTLSWSIRRWLGIYPKNAKRARWAVPVFVVLELLAIGFLVWFGWHILTQGPAEAHFYRLER
jgi:hypothetical protein